MDSIQPNSDGQKEFPKAKDAAKNPGEKITAVAQMRVPVPKPVREAEHTISLTPTHEKTLHALLPWMQIPAPGSRELNKHEVRVY